MLRAIIPVASVAVTIFALADCVQTKDDRVRGIPKWAWIVLVVLIPWVGPITWLVVGKDRSQGDGGQPGRAPRRQGRRAPEEILESLGKLAGATGGGGGAGGRGRRDGKAGQGSPADLRDDTAPSPARRRNGSPTTSPEPA